MQWYARRGVGRLGTAFLVSALVAVATLIATPPAGAATQLGETFAPPAGFCDPGFTNITAASPGSSYAVPSAGVITAWSYQADATPPSVAFKVARNDGGGSFTILADSGLQTPAPGALHTAQARIPVSGGELIGIFTSNAECGRGAAGYSTFYRPSNSAASSMLAYSGPASYQLDVSALLEPDADNDGFGDETQDQCPTDPASQGDCAPPETTITKRPKDKTKRKQAEFEFISSEPGSSFECAQDGSPFAACTSPLIRKVGKGKHAFQVRAIDAVGNVDGTPATAQWKVKRKRK